MISLIRVLYAELYKTKRTLALLLVVVAPLAVAFLQFMSYFTRGSIVNPPNTDMWVRLTMNNVILWALLMLPLYISLETALLTGFEHGNKMWKQIYALPVPRWTIYAAKQIMSMTLIGVSTLVLLALIFLSGLLLRQIRPDLGFGSVIPWDKMAAMVGLVYLGSWLIISFHLWVSARWPSFVVALGAGILATTANIMLVNSDYGDWYPWMIPGLVGMNYISDKAMLPQLLLGVVGGVLLSLIAGWDVIRRDVA